jgi:hypothetical protein
VAAVLGQAVGARADCGSVRRAPCRAQPWGPAPWRCRWCGWTACTAP